MLYVILMPFMSSEMIFCLLTYGSQSNLQWGSAQIRRGAAILADGRVQ